MASGRSAGAEVLLAEPAAGLMRSGISTGDVSTPLNMRLRIVAGDEPPFDLNVKMEVPLLMTPTVGMTLQVIYDPGHPDKIAADTETDPIAAAEAASRQMRENLAARNNAQLRESLRSRRGALQAQAAAGSVEVFKAQLEKLNDLKATGALDENEYQAARQRLLDKL
jgi:hypothetical protein